MTLADALHSFSGPDDILLEARRVAHLLSLALVLDFLHMLHWSVEEVKERLEALK